MSEDIRFSEHKDRIVDRLRSKTLSFNNDDSFIIVDSFVQIPVEEVVNKNKPTVGGPTIPAVCIIGNSTGQVYLFALGALFPNFDMAAPLKKERSRCGDHKGLLGRIFQWCIGKRHKEAGDE